MLPLDYQTVATAIAEAETQEERDAAAFLFNAYYASSPQRESVTERRRLLLDALRFHLSRRAPATPSQQPEP